MAAMRAPVLLLFLLLPGLLLGGETKTEAPKLSILSPEGAGRDVKVFNDDSALFFARRSGDARGRLLNGVKFVLYKAGGKPSRPSDLIASSEDPDRWGPPPTSFALPLELRSLPVGRYRLRAVKTGWERAEIGVVKAKFGYFDLEKIHKKDRYIASPLFYLDDRSEKRSEIKLTIRVVGATGAVLDRAERMLRPDPGHRFCFETTKRLRLSSKAVKPPEGKSGSPGRALVLAPGCSLVVFLDRVRFTWPIPLPSEGKRGSCGPADKNLEGTERSGRGR